ncbi:MATE family efflux transporter [Treponema pectinovorum]|uniref:MATE family efflux transporter n=1 Tax=Treponema pectinovorum TaxID=164 RepID=UPI0011F24155|nr:MATE family efflux transporter [Treponema pectinovorum]
MASIKGFAQIDLIKGNIFKSIILFTLPLLVSYIFQQLYNAADTVIIGRLLDENSLVAIGACAALYELLTGFGIGFGNGLSIVAARAYGAGNYESLKKITAASFFITFGVTILIMVICQIWLKPMMILLKTPAEHLEEAYSYISIITFFCGVLFAYNLFAGMLRAIGNSVVPLIFLIFSSILNVILDVIFIKQTGGIKGAAIATVLSQFVSALLCLIYIFFKAKILVPSARHFLPDKKLYKDLIGQGLSMALMGSIVHTGTVILQTAINSLDAMIIAGHLCARKVFALTNIPVVTLGFSVSTFVSQNFGANQIERIKKGVKIAIFITGIWTLILILPARFVVVPLIKFMTGSQNQTIIDYASKYIFFTIPFYLVLGGLLITRNALQGLGKKLLPLISSLIEFLGKVFFTYLIIPRIGSWGVILCEPLIWCAMLSQLLFVFIRLPIFRRKTV